MYNGSVPWVSNPVAQKILTYTQVAYPIILICLYIITFTVRSVVTARNDNDTTKEPEQLGPGGKALPPKIKKAKSMPNGLDLSKPRKLLFEWLSVGVLASLAGNIVVVIVHTLVERDQSWWCGQSPTVSSTPRSNPGGR